MMSNVFKYPIGDSYPDIGGQLTYKGSVNTEFVTLEMLANKQSTGPFTGPVTITEFDSENSTSSSLKWLYIVRTSDTAIEERYELQIRVIHADSSIETIELVAVEVGDA